MVELATLQAVSYIMGSLGVFVAAIYYILNIQNNTRNQRLQLETRQAQLYNSVWNQSCNNPEFQKSFLRFQKLEWSNYEEYISLCPVNEAESENTMAVWSIALFFEGLSPLVKDGLIEMKYLANSILWYFLRIYWMKIAIIADEARMRWDLPTCWDETEALYNLIKEYREKNQVKT